MNMLTKFFFAIFIAIIYLFASPKQAKAYIDPGAGSYIVQIIIASILGVLFAIKIYWDKIKSFIKKLFTKNKGKNETKNTQRLLS